MFLSYDYLSTILIQSPDEPREQRLGRVQPKKFEIKFHTKNDRNGNYTLEHSWNKWKQLNEWKTSFFGKGGGGQLQPRRGPKMREVAID